MTKSESRQDAATQCLDHLFARLAGHEDAVPPPQSPPPTNSGPPPSIRGRADLEAASEWLQRERGRLDAYTQSQLDRLHKERQSLLSQNYLNEQGLITRAQELDRKEQFPMAQNRELQARLDARLAAAEQAEAASRRRQVELDEMEARLLSEVRAEQRRLARQRAELEKWSAQLAELEDELAGVQEELEGHSRQLEERERLLVRREQVARPGAGRAG